MALCRLRLRSLPRSWPKRPSNTQHGFARGQQFAGFQHDSTESTGVSMKVKAPFMLVRDGRNGFQLFAWQVRWYAGLGYYWGYVLDRIFWI
jgi:hypothetical protein